MTSLIYHPGLPYYRIEIKGNIWHKHHLLQDALGSLLHKLIFTCSNFLQERSYRWSWCRGSDDRCTGQSWKGAKETFTEKWYERNGPSIGRVW